MDHHPPPAVHSSYRSGEMGLGIILGDPTGLTGKYWLSRDNAIDAGLAFAWDDSFLTYVDYLFQFPGAFGGRTKFGSQLNPYIGIGGILAVSTRDSTKDRAFFNRTSSSVGFGVRIPIGIEWLPSKPSIGVFAEIAPGISVIPHTNGLVQGGIGIRFYF